MTGLVTGLTVCYNTEQLVRNAIGSVRAFYPGLPLVIVDNSDRKNPCAAYVRSLRSDETTVIVPGKNIGHGPGMNLGLRQVKTRFALIFDSDIVLKKPCLELMLDKMRDDTFGVGEVMPFYDPRVPVKIAPQLSAREILADRRNAALERARRRRRRESFGQHSPFLEMLGQNRATTGMGISTHATAGPPAQSWPTIPYLHPRFQLINVANYRLYKPYIQHGAPCLSTMIDIYERGLSKKVLVNFPIADYADHVGRGTRRVFPGWQKVGWDKI